MIWRLGIDLGTNSLGWAALELHVVEGEYVPFRLIDCGVRIYSDGRNPKDKQSNAAQRRGPKGARKNRDRYKHRRARLMRQLVEAGLMPRDKAAQKALEGGKGQPLADSDPWILRARALVEEISPYQLGRAIFHLHQRRGFQSNRKTDRVDSESGKVADATKRTLEKMHAAGARTLGELFGRPRWEALLENASLPRGQRRPQPLARVRKSGEGAKWQYEYYPTRALILDEFDQILAAQAVFHGNLLNDAARDVLRDTIEWQHPLKSPPVGRCSLLPEEPRAPKALPTSQRARIFQEVNALKVGGPGEAKVSLTLEQRDKVAERLLNPTSKTGEVSFKHIRNLLGLSDAHTFNTESEKRAKLKGDETAARLMQDDRYGPGWLALDLATRDEIVRNLDEEENVDRLLAWLRLQHGLDHDRAARVAGCRLPDGYGNLSTEALGLILPHLEAEVVVYSDAVRCAGMHHSQFGTGELFDEGLPYYGIILERSVAFGSGKPGDGDEKRYGRVANPTVHVALNQVRAVVNDLIKRFGAPEQIVLELARDLPLSAKGKSEIEARQKRNQDENERRNAQLREVYEQAETYDNRMRLRLYEELEALGKRCVFSGVQIGAHNLFSPEIEIEHILPFSRTLDDSFSNKTLSTRQANRDKKNQSPFEVFHHSPAGYDWDEISNRANELPHNKRWRFEPDAMERYENEERDFLARQLTDTQYIARLAKAYVEAIYGGQGHAGGENYVWVITGRQTADLRWQWGLDSVLHGHNLEISQAQRKNRDDHRHHAIDAIVIACTDRAMLKAAADAAKKSETENNERLIAAMDPPWDGFRDEVAAKVRGIVVSHKPDHGYQAAILKDGAMSMIPESGRAVSTAPMMQKYISLDAIDAKALDAGNKKSWTIVDLSLRKELAELTQGKTKPEFKRAVDQWARNKTPGIRRIRVYKRESGFGIAESTGMQPYKYYSSAGNYCYDIWMGPKGKWTGEVISTFEAYQMGRKDPNWWTSRITCSGQPLIMRLRKDDCLQIDHDGNTIIVRVAVITPGTISMIEHFEANVDSRNRDKEDELSYIRKSPSSLQKSSAIYATTSPSGFINIHD